MLPKQYLPCYLPKNLAATGVVEVLDGPPDRGVPMFPQGLSKLSDNLVLGRNAGGVVFPRTAKLSRTKSR